MTKRTVPVEYRNQSLKTAELTVHCSKDRFLRRGFLLYALFNYDNILINLSDQYPFLASKTAIPLKDRSASY